MPRSFSIFTLGCKLNQYESQQMRELLESFGLTQVEATPTQDPDARPRPHSDPSDQAAPGMGQQPQLVVINTCCVTHTASAKSRHLINQAQRKNPQNIVVCGCLPTVETDELRVTGENVHVVKDRCDLAATLSLLVDAESTTPNSHASQQPDDAIIRAKDGSKVKCKNDLCRLRELPPLTSFQRQTRAFLKVQDGCDALCTYCIVPSSRPKVVFRKVEDILAEAAALVSAGHKEIVLTGVHIGSYGQTTVRRRHWPTAENPHLPDLLDRVARVPGLRRIRLSSLDPADVTTALLDVFCAHPNIMPHLHLSLQSGSDSVLRRMARSYTADDFRAKLALIKSRLDRPALTTDIIVGFPGETDADFEQTVALAKEVAFSKMHVFAFSSRKGTAAAKMQPKIPPEVKKERSRLLRDLDRDLQSRFRAQFLGETAHILIETSAGRPTGRAERYFTVQVVDDKSDTSYKSYANQIVPLRLERNAATAVLATLLPEGS